jgi:hypothetical protein
MKWANETALEVCLIERMRLFGDWISVKRRWTISMRGVIVEVAVCPALQPLVLSWSNRQIVHAEIVVIAECVTVKRRQLYLLLWCGCIGGISEPIEIRGTQWLVFFSRARQLVEQIGSVRSDGDPEPKKSSPLFTHWLSTSRSKIGKCYAGKKTAVAARTSRRG